MAFTLNRRLAQLIDGNGQLNTGKIPNDYITSDHVADNTITSAMLHTSFTVSTSNLTAIDTDDVSEGSSNLYFTDARAQAVSINNVVEDTTPQLGGDLASNGNDILFADNDKAIFGAGSDLQIYHDGNHSYVQDTGAGDLRLLGNNLQLKNGTATENYLTATENAGVSVYYDNAEKLATTSTGIDVTGTISSGAITSSGKIIATQLDLAGADVYIAYGTAGTAPSNGDYLRLRDVATGNDALQFYMDSVKLFSIDGQTGNAYHKGTISSGAITSTGAIEGASFSDGTISGITFIDEDSFATNSATRIPTQQSIKAYVDTQVAGVVDSAPAALDTLNELAAALGDDANFSTTTSTALGNRLRVDTAAQGLTGTQQANAITNLGITATKAELNYVDGVTSAIQTQLDGKQATGSYLTGNQTITLSGDVSGSGTTSISVTVADDSHNHVISNVDGLQTALDAKLASSSYTASDVLTKIKTVDGSGSGLDADLLDGLTLHTARNNEANKVVRTDGNGYIQAGWINTTSGTTTGTNRIYASDDGYIRYVTPATLISNLGLFTTSNDGSGSGLDADLLDGQHGSYYYAASNPSGYQTASGTVSQSSQSLYVSGSAFATTGSPGSVLEYQQASGQTDTRLAPNGDWHNSIRMGHGNPYNYYSNTIAMRMTGGGSGTMFTQHISNNSPQGWRTQWDSGNDGSGSGLDADNLDGLTWASSGKDVRATEFYADNWFRNYNSGEGLYNQATSQHFYSDDDDYWNIAGGSGANALRFRDEYAGTIRGYVYANSSSQIGFLNSSGSWSLKCDNSGNVTATGNVTAYSDIRLKENIKVIPDALSKVQQIRGVTFTRNDTEDLEKLHTGVIAQEVEAVLPEAVSEDNDGIKNIAYGNMVGLLIEAIKEQQETIEKLTSRITDIEKGE
jgi:hypothetical protein